MERYVAYVRGLLLEMGEQLKAGQRTIREIAIFTDEEVTEDRLEERAKEVLKQIEGVKKAIAAFKAAEAKFLTIKKGKTKAELGKWRKARGNILSCGSRCRRLR